MSEEELELLNYVFHLAVGECYSEEIDDICKLQEKIINLNNMINTLEKELREDYKIWMCDSRSNGKSVKFGIDVCKTHFYNRLQELKENK